MKAAVLAGNCKMSYKEVEDPQPDSKHVIVKVKKIAICGSDVHMWEMGEAMEDMIIGHEYCGVVDDPGDLAGSLKRGDRVTSLTSNPDLSCPYCLEGKDNLCEDNYNSSPGTFTNGICADYFAARTDLVRKLPDNASDEEGAMVEPASVALHAVKKAAIKPGDKVLITGAGVIGAFVAEFARYYGAGCIVATDVNMERANRLVEYGTCDAVFNSKSPDLDSKLDEACGGVFDVYFECTGIINVLNDTLDAVRRGGLIILIGINPADSDPISVLNIILKEYRIYGSYAYTVADFDQVIAMMAGKKINLQRYAGKTFALADMQHAFEYLKQKDVADFKVFLTP